RLALSGKRHAIEALRDGDVRVRIDLGALTAGEHMVKLSANNVDLPVGFKIVRVTPRVIRVLIKRSAEKRNRE
ncbi:MAG: hypothetical protein GY849_04455, partial [Deltaproteobacteria bacterium]|nr:hypothetical protein [Deltaproteobacteria bacterium]